MFLGVFERVLKGLQKTGLNRSRPVKVNRFFCGLYISKIKRPDAGLVFCGLGPVWLQSFSSHETGLPNTKDHPCLEVPSVPGHPVRNILQEM